MAVFVLAVVAGIKGLQHRVRWGPFCPPGGGYSVLMPGTPKRVIRFDEKDAPVQSEDHELLWEEEGFVFSVSSFQLDQDVPYGAIERRMDDVLKHMVVGVGGALVRDRTISLGDHPGVEGWMVLKAGEGPQVVEAAKIRVYLVYNRIYTVCVRYPPQAAASPHIGRFFDSFHLIQRFSPA